LSGYLGFGQAGDSNDEASKNTSNVLTILGIPVKANIDSGGKKNGIPE
jgi:hypothetical protein